MSSQPAHGRVEALTKANAEAIQKIIEIHCGRGFSRQNQYLVFAFVDDAGKSKRFSGKTSSDFCADSFFFVNHLRGGLPVANVFQILGDEVGHLLGKVFEFWSLHVDLKLKFNSRLDRGLAMKKKSSHINKRATTKA